MSHNTIGLPGFGVPGPFLSSDGIIGRHSLVVGILKRNGVNILAAKPVSRSRTLQPQTRVSNGNREGTEDGPAAAVLTFALGGPGFLYLG